MRVDAEAIGRYAQDVEATVYFCVLEALQNVQKHKEAWEVVVRLRENGGHLRFEVSDDGQGFDVATTKRGAGLTNMSDRVDSVGGGIQVTSRPRAGTCVRGELPAGVRVAAPG